jgi:hypothetical protein
LSRKEGFSLPQNGTEDRLEPGSTRPSEVRASRRQSPTTGTDEEGAKPVINWEFPPRV